MQAPDVNVLVYSHREELPEHEACRKWLEGVLSGPSAFALTYEVLSGFVRVVTHPRVFLTPSPLSDALEFARILLAQPHAVLVGPGPRHWDVFSTLCLGAGVKGNLVADAHHAAIAIESGCEWVTTDRDYSRFPGLRLWNPLA
ncbi:MAG TPA: type II toxin-antitoxin system VapC family toxin [Gaiellaceae bacterium]|nr:type II toxin-antitoxin system VapC family toxin [Gaiellaceae bacterium]